MPGSNSRPNVSEGYEVPTELPGAMGPLKCKKKTQTNVHSFPRQIFLYSLLCMCPASLKFKNEAHLGHINLKMMPTLGTSGPLRQVLYSASKGVNSSVKNTDLQKQNKNIPTKMTYGNLFILFFGVP